MKANLSYDWQPPKDWIKISTIDVHTEGEPLRIILKGFPKLVGDSIIERRRFAKENYDYLRTAFMWEPRGHADMYGCIIVPSVTPEADFGVLFLHNEGFSTMCGHGIIGVTKAMLELGLLPKEEPITRVLIDTPAGLVTAYAKIERGNIECIYFHNVPSFVLGLDEVVDIAGLGKIQYDLAFGGAFYAYVKSADIGLTCTPENYRQLIDVGMAIKDAVRQTHSVEHPFDSDLSFLYGVIFISPPLTDGADSRNVCIFAEGEVDRSPTGTGVSGRMAIHFARGEVKMKQPLVIESIIGSRFTGRVVTTTTFGPYNAVIPEVEGTAYIIGKNEFFIDPQDPFKYGFMLR